MRRQNLGETLYFVFAAHHRVERVLGSGAGHVLAKLVEHRSVAGARAGSLAARLGGSVATHGAGGVALGAAVGRVGIVGAVVGHAAVGAHTRIGQAAGGACLGKEALVGEAGIDERLEYIFGLDLVIVKYRQEHMDGLYDLILEHTRLQHRELGDAGRKVAHTHIGRAGGADVESRIVEVGDESVDRAVVCSALHGSESLAARLRHDGEQQMLGLDMGGVVTLRLAAGAGHHGLEVVGKSIVHVLRCSKYRAKRLVIPKINKKPAYAQPCLQLLTILHLFLVNYIKNHPILRL